MSKTWAQATSLPRNWRKDRDERLAHQPPCSFPRKVYSKRLYTVNTCSTWMSQEVCERIVLTFVIQGAGMNLRTEPCTEGWSACTYEVKHPMGVFISTALSILNSGSGSKKNPECEASLCNEGQGQKTKSWNGSGSLKPATKSRTNNISKSDLHLSSEFVPSIKKLSLSQRHPR